MNREVVLAIETGIAGGSLSILRNGSEIDFWKGEEKISRSEDLLINISGLLEKNSLYKNDIKKIFVSKGPGSFTGVRVGIATAKGLQKALKCECSGVSVLEAMVLKTKNPGKSVTGFAVGRNQVCWQTFQTDALSEIRNLDFAKISLIKDFAAKIENQSSFEFILNADLLNKITEAAFDIDFARLKIEEFKENPAKYIGLRGEQIFSGSGSGIEILPEYAGETRTV